MVMNISNSNYYNNRDQLTNIHNNLNNCNNRKVQFNKI